MKKYTYHPMHMHIHTCFQSGACMESQLYNAHKLGMKYIRFTDHDSTLCRTFTPNIDFSRNELEYKDENRVRVRFDPIGESALDFEGDALRVTAEREGGTTLWTQYHRHMITLLSDVTVRVGAVLKSGSGDLTLTFSERPPEMRNAKLVYPLKPGRNDFFLRLSDEITEELGGLDNALTDIALHVTSGTLLVDKLELDCMHDAAEIHRRQKELAEKLGEKYGIKPFVTFEVSGAGEHKNCYSTWVPIVDYTKYDHPLGEKEAADYLLSHGATFSYNHPFLHAASHKKGDLTATELENVVRLTAADIISTKAYGASAIEIGFPRGRGSKGFTLEHHLMFWDILNSAGLFLTAVGDSDSHSSKAEWFSGNNFAVWTAADADIPFPVPEEEFIASIRAGRAFTGDPVQFNGTADLTGDGLPMGAIIPVTDKTVSEKHTYTFTADSLKSGMKVRIIADGELISEHIAEDGQFEYTYELSPIHTVSFTRVELWNEEGRCILLTNPIYTVNTDKFAGDIPKERVYGG
ncbi:MAG: hypothetical protein IJ428_02230 [Clostridia bacterium]|nr:hypothetical protein [Clostridia bacterium]